ncbi:hypothetical protein [Lewinella sp. W8]|uniref:hypothetical protein n=1 Tax=Lewinella sp. W8 TaxID=2528208 RepID=UPI0010675A47|nr:hypothetical protein [Lewinella sp. W8]MTB52150.1 hypothetical protein [Lewinella sp. W8]
MRIIIRRSAFYIVVFCLSCLGCEKTPLREAIEEVADCADFSEFESSVIDSTEDSVFFSGTLDNIPIIIKDGFKDYRVRFVDEELLIINNPNQSQSTVESRYQFTFAIGQEAASGSSFVGAPLFSASIQFPCSEEFSTPLEYVDHLKVGVPISIIGQGMACDQGAKVVLRAYCFDFYANGRGFYAATPLSSEAGFQGNNHLVLTKASAIQLAGGEILVDLEGNFSCDLYFNTRQGGNIFFGKLDQATFRIHRILNK